MKKIMLSFLITVCVGGAVMAQDSTRTQNQTSQGDQAKQDEWEKKLRDDLKLSPDQATKYDAISKEYKSKADALRQDASITPDAMMERKMALKKEKQTRLFEFLTPEQQTRYKTWMDKKDKEDGDKSGS